DAVILLGRRVPNLEGANNLDRREVWHETPTLHDEVLVEDERRSALCMVLQPIGQGVDRGPLPWPPGHFLVCQQADTARLDTRQRHPRCIAWVKADQVELLLPDI